MMSILPHFAAGVRTTSVRQLSRPAMRAFLLLQIFQQSVVGAVRPEMAVLGRSGGPADYFEITPEQLFRVRRPGHRLDR